MVREKNVVVIDVDGTLTLPRDGQAPDYAQVACSQAMRTKIIDLKAKGHWIVLYSSRNMRTHAGNMGLIIKHTAPVLIKWLDDHQIPYDELHFGKPWCGEDGFYVDDRAIRPREFVEHDWDELQAIVAQDRLSQ